MRSVWFGVAIVTVGVGIAGASSGVGKTEAAVAGVERRVSNVCAGVIGPGAEAAGAGLGARDVNSGPERQSFSNPNEFLAGGSPTFILGTLGGDEADRAVAAQVDLVMNLLFPEAAVRPDTSVDVAAGERAWPGNAVIYGGPHVNSVLARLRESLPFRLERGKLELGGEVFEGDEYRLIAVVPAGKPAGGCPGHPEFLVYAGTGCPGVAEINAIPHGGHHWLVADTFGPLIVGRWTVAEDGALKAEILERGRRIKWRSFERTFGPGEAGKEAKARFLFPEMLEPSPDEGDVVDSCIRGLNHTAGKLRIVDPVDISIYVYPDVGSKRSLTGNPGQGHAEVSLRTLHLVRFDPSEGGPLESLVRHEGAHVLAYGAWGPPRMPLLGEGVAVWASGGYGGTELEDWMSNLSGAPPPVAKLLGRDFLQMPEGQSYPLAGIFVGAAIKEVGLDKLRDILWNATAATWEASCRDAGTNPRALEQAFRGLLERK